VVHNRCFRTCYRCKIWTPLGKLFAPPGVPSWLRACRRTPAQDAAINSCFPSLYRFTVQHSWAQHSGGLKVEDKMAVTVNEPGLSSCFDALKVDEKYIIMVAPTPANNGDFAALEAPVSTQRRRHKQSIWKRLCSSASDMSGCRMRVVMPGRVVYYRGSMKLLPCRVESGSAVREVTWYKDGSDIDTTFYRMAGLEVNKFDMENSFVMFREASSMHNGLYTCKVTNADGETVDGKTEILVLGPQMASHFGPCAEPNYCFNSGKCSAFLTNPQDKICECKPGFRGERCGQTDTGSITFDPEGVKDPTNGAQQVAPLTTAVVLLSCAVVGLIIIGITYRSHVGRRHRKDRRGHDRNVEEALIENGRGPGTELSERKPGPNGAVTIVVTDPEHHRQSTLSSQSTSTSSHSIAAWTREQRTSRSASTTSQSVAPPTPRGRLHANS